MEQIDYQQKANEFFNIHETFMVNLCEILDLDYLEATEQDVIQAVNSMKNFLNENFWV